MTPIFKKCKLFALINKKDLKMNKKIMLFLASTILFLSSCANVTTQSVDLEPGMSKAELTSILGKPGKKQISGIAEAWQYCNTGFAADNYIIVWLVNDEVVETQDYLNTVGVGACSSFFKSVDWKEAPDKILELREMYE